MTAERRRTALEWLLRGLVLSVVVVAVAVSALTRTEWGRDRILRLTVNAVQGQLTGTLRVGRLAGDLLTGARLYDVALSGPENEPFLRADSAYLEYDLPTLIGGDVVLNRVALFGPVLRIRRLPGDTMWNFERLTQPSTDSIKKPGRAVAVHRGTLRNATVIVELPWEPDSTLIEAARDSAIAAALADTSRLVVRRVPGGLLRTILVRLERTRLGSSVFAGRDRGGSYLAVRELAGTLRVADEPLRIRGLEGDLATRNGVYRFRFEPLLLDSSRITAYGVARFGGVNAQRDLLIHAAPLRFADLQPLLPGLPAQGTVQGWFQTETRPDGTLYRARELHLTAPGTRLDGSFAAVVGDSLRIIEADLEAPEFDVPTLEQVLPAGLPVRGLQIGSAEIR